MPRLVRLPPEVRQTIRVLHPEQKRRVRVALDRLQADPTIGKELKAELGGWRSLRVGRLRIIYRFDRTTIDVAAIGSRTSIYVESARLTRSQARQNHEATKNTKSGQGEERE